MVGVRNSVDVYMFEYFHLSFSRSVRTATKDVCTFPPFFTFSTFVNRTHYPTLYTEPSIHPHKHDQIRNILRERDCPLPESAFSTASDAATSSCKSSTSAHMSVLPRRPGIASIPAPA